MSSSEDDMNNDESVAEYTGESEGCDEMQIDLEMRSVVPSPDTTMKRPAAARTEQANTGNTSDETADVAPAPKMKMQHQAAAGRAHTNSAHSSDEMVDVTSAPKFKMKRPAALRMRLELSDDA
eukprot:12424748-Karenia_brevis.AAC.1